MVKFLKFSVISLLLFLIVFLQLHQDLNNLNEKIEKVHEEDHGVGWYVSHVLGLGSLDDHLGIIDDVHACDEESKEKVCHVVSGISEHIAHHAVPEHA